MPNMGTIEMTPHVMNEGEQLPLPTLKTVGLTLIYILCVCM